MFLGRVVTDSAHLGLTTRRPPRIYDSRARCDRFGSSRAYYSTGVEEVKHRLSILGLSPPWYKSRVFRARAVREPRNLLREEFGLEISGDVALRVHDSTADLRYLVIPRRPPGTEGWSEADLVALVSRDTMIGPAESLT